MKKLSLRRTHPVHLTVASHAMWNDKSAHTRGILHQKFSVSFHIPRLLNAIDLDINLTYARFENVSNNIPNHSESYFKENLLTKEKN